MKRWLVGACAAALVAATLLVSAPSSGAAEPSVLRAPKPPAPANVTVDFTGTVVSWTHPSRDKKPRFQIEAVDPASGRSRTVSVSFPGPVASYSHSLASASTSPIRVRNLVAVKVGSRTRWQPGPWSKPARVLWADAAAVGNSASCALSGGRTYCWGSVPGTDIPSPDIPDEGGSARPELQPLVPEAVQLDVGGGVSCGPSPTDYCLGMDLASGTACVVTVDRDVYCWGRGKYGQLGDGSFSDSPEPVRVRGLSGVDQVSVGDRHVCAVSSGAVYCWGQHGMGKFDAVSAVPVVVPEVSDVTSVSAGDGHTCALAQERVYCWGNNWAGQLGTPSSQLKSYGPPVQVPGVPASSSVSVGYGFTCAVAVEGDVYCWGLGGSGQLGRPGTSYQDNPPAKVSVLSSVSQVAAGMAHVCAVDDGDLFCWGGNYVGQVGSGSASDPGVKEPVLLRGLKDVRSVSLSADHSCAVADQSVYCWGNNFHKKVGTKSPSAVPSPQLVLQSP